MIQEEDRIYFNPGELVQIKHDLPNKPVMMVVKKETSIFKNNGDLNNALKGIRCRWFTKNHELLEAIFNTKDIEKIN